MGEKQEKFTIKDLPLSERPYEKLEKLGAEMLSNAELLAIIIKTGSKDETSVSLAQRILKQDESDSGFDFLYNISLEQLRSIKGIGRVKSVQVKALMELAKRIASTYGMGNRVVIKSPDDVKKLVMEEMRHLKKEVFKVILLNTKSHLIKHINISMGSLNASVVHPREVFSEAVKVGCSGLIFVHNHPSGDPEPSLEDLETTERLVSGGNILGIKVLDHIIIGNGTYMSFKERGLI
ncbi:MAG: DNA repair protein RadC [Clostridiales bacterium]|jgi:DNA repair protein RadC|nr:DNA repair protein RadC [Eubacteriales bacterium]MDH7566404.1 DNA repair protein RadC [Clostridiales bacterium]